MKWPAPWGTSCGTSKFYAAFGVYRHAQNGANSPGNAITGEGGPLDSATADVIQAAGTRIGGWPTSTTSIATPPKWALTDLISRSIPAVGPRLSGATNNYTDIAEDFQIQFIGEKNTATLKGTYVRENQSLNATGPAGLGTSNASDWLSYLSTDFTYWYKRKYGFTVGYLSTQGSTDNRVQWRMRLRP